MKNNYRRVLLFILVNAVFIIQVGIAILFYQEYLQGKKVDELAKKMGESDQVKALTHASRKDLFQAQDFLKQYIEHPKKEILDHYFASLHSVSENLEKIGRYAPIQKEIQNLIKNHPTDFTELKELKTLVDSTQVVSQHIVEQSKQPTYKVKPYVVKGGDNLFDIEVKKTVDSVKKKGLFSRLGDAVSGKTDVQKETIIITTKQGGTTSTEKLKSDFDSIIQSANQHYTHEINTYKNRLKVIQKKDQPLLPVFDQLLVSSNQLMDFYTLAVDRYNDDLKKQYAEQNSKVKKYRNNAVFALMLLMIVVSVTVIYLAIESIRKEKKLTQANTIIQEHLNFKNRVLGMFSHEMRAPMQIMNIFLQRIAKIAVLDEVQQYVKTIQFTNKSLLIQASQILEYAKNQDRKLELKKSEISMKENIDELLVSFQPFIESRNNQFETETKIDPNLKVNTDFAKIHQLYTNILGNANKFTENGKISVFTEVHPDANGNYKMNTKISDTGMGISENDLKAIFEPYYQGLVSDKVENVGVGLGLNLCKEIVELFHGEIGAFSEKGKGTTIEFNIIL
ncbi:MAG: HAMP domain-containing histidine kinase [Bacteroidetes bacterium]|nr:HAMP domain-containing histidine kinase [Bacteroidota bacterium]